MGLAGIGLGLIGGGIGAGAQGLAGDIRRKKLTSVANTPGLDIEDITGKSLATQERFLPQAQNLATAEATGQQALKNQLLEQSLPGFTALRGRATDIATDYLNNPFSAEDLRAAQYNTAVQALGGGFAGSGRQGNLLGVHLYDTAQARKQVGLQWLQALRGLSPTVNPVSPLGFTPDVNTWLNIRGNERTQRMNLLAQASQIPGKTAAFGSFMSGLGGGLLGAGLGGMGGGTGMGGDPLSSMMRPGFGLPENWNDLGLSGQRDYARAVESAARWNNRYGSVEDIWNRANAVGTGE